MASSIGVLVRMERRMDLLKEEKSRVRDPGKRRIAKVGLWAFVAIVFAYIPSCKALNESPNNKKFWFPTIAPPTEKEKAMRRANFPEGCDPFVDANVGPRSFDTRPAGWRDQRSKTSDVFGAYPDVSYD